MKHKYFHVSNLTKPAALNPAGLFSGDQILQYYFVNIKKNELNALLCDKLLTVTGPSTQNKARRTNDFPFHASQGSHLATKQYGIGLYRDRQKFSN